MNMIVLYNLNTLLFVFDEIGYFRLWLKQFDCVGASNCYVFGWLGYSEPYSDVLLLKEIPFPRQSSETLSFPSIWVS